MKKQKAIFLDRDGVLNYDYGYNFKLSKLKIINDTIDNLEFFKSKKFIFIIITNQSGLARKYYNLKEFNEFNKKILKILKLKKITIKKIYYCPHLPEDKCFCRKPLPGMIKKASKEFNINLKKSILIGDQKSDIEAGLNSGIVNNFLLRKKDKIKKNYIEIKSLNSIKKVLFNDCT
jgi:D-glycero-D-manno-heptose 1,7-bisphosphate phosphatase